MTIFYFFQSNLKDTFCPFSSQSQIRQQYSKEQIAGAERRTCSVEEGLRSALFMFLSIFKKVIYQYFQQKMFGHFLKWILTKKSETMRTKFYRNNFLEYESVGYFSKTFWDSTPSKRCTASVRKGFCKTLVYLFLNSDVANGKFLPDGRIFNLRYVLDRVRMYFELNLDSD